MITLMLCGGAIFGESGEQEEIDYLLFEPNSSSRFVDNEQAAIQLDKIAKYLKAQELVPGQISIYGYAAAVVNDIEATDLSRDRALLVINELNKRGLPKEVFADPVGYGEVDLWGDNTDTQSRSLNRRVRIMMDEIVISPVIIQEPDPEPEVQYEEIIEQEEVIEESDSSFPWWLLLIPLIALIILLLFLASRRKKEKKPPVQKTVEPVIVPVVPIVKIKILEEEEIRCYAYGLYERRYGQNGDDAGDWFQSIRELSDIYEAQGYRVILYWEPEAQQ